MAEYIDREKIAAEVRELSTHVLNEWDTMGVLALIDRQSAVDVAPVVHAHWKEIAHEGTTTLCECTSCGDWMFFHYEYSPNYCPTCGAKMDESEDEGDE